MPALSGANTGDLLERFGSCLRGSLLTCGFSVLSSEIAGCDTASKDPRWWTVVTGHCTVPTCHMKDMATLAEARDSKHSLAHLSCLARDWARDKGQ